MFCPQCGMKIPENSKFCMGCGSKLPGSFETQAQTPVHTTEVSNTFIGKLYTDFYDMAHSLSSNYVDSLDSRYENLDTFILNAETNIPELFHTADEYILHLLHEQGIHQFEEKHISAYTGKYTGLWLEVFNEALQAYQNITGQEQQMREYRAMRKGTRGRVIGGGFGASGAIKGMAAAGAVNMTTGLLHSFTNALGNAKSAAEADRQKKTYFTDQRFRDELQSAIEADISNMLQGVCELWEALELGKLPYYSLEDSEQAFNIGHSVLTGQVPKGQIESSLIQMLTIYPVSFHLYIVAVGLLPEKSDVFFEMANKYGFDIESYLSERNALAKTHAEHLCRNDLFGALYESLNFDIGNTVELVYGLFKDELDTIFTVLSDSAKKECASKLKKMHESFAKYGRTETPVLFIISSSSGDNRGILLTDQRLYVHSNKSGEKSRSFELADITALEIIADNSDPSKPLYNLRINEEVETTVFRGTKGRDFIVPIMSFFIDYCLYINTAPIQIDRDFMPCILRHIDMSLEEFEAYADSQNSLSDDDDYNGEYEEEPLSEDADSTPPAELPCDADSLIKLIEQNTFSSLQKSDIFNVYFHSCRGPMSEERRTQFSKFKAIYRDVINSGELVLFYYDNSMLRNAKESFLITDKGIHFCSTRFPSGRIAYKDIKSIDIRTVKMFPNIIINGNIIIPVRFMFDECYDFINDLQNYVIPLLKNRS